MMSIRIYSAVSADAVGVLAEVPPTEFLIQKCAVKYGRVDSCNSKGKFNREMASQVGRLYQWPDTRDRNLMNRECNEVNYFLTKALIRLGSFLSDLYKRHRV